MKTAPVKTHFIKWLSIEEIHEDSKDWLLELDFLKDEYHFFVDLIKCNTIELIDFKGVAECNKIIKNLSDAKKENDHLTKLVKAHEKKLVILVDKNNHTKDDEDNYKDEHVKLIILMKNHLIEHRSLKLSLFDILKKIKKIEKQKHRIDLK